MASFALFAIYGVDTISVTIVVTAFMLGLGSLVGGVVSRRRPRAAVALFAWAGCCVYPIDWMGDRHDPDIVRYGVQDGERSGVWQVRLPE